MYSLIITGPQWAAARWLMEGYTADIPAVFEVRCVSIMDRRVKRQINQLSSKCVYGISVNCNVPDRNNKSTCLDSAHLFVTSTRVHHVPAALLLLRSKSILLSASYATILRPWARVWVVEASSLKVSVQQQLLFAGICLISVDFFSHQPTKWCNF